MWPEFERGSAYNLEGDINNDTYRVVCLNHLAPLFHPKRFPASVRDRVRSSGMVNINALLSESGRSGVSTLPSTM